MKKKKLIIAVILCVIIPAAVISCFFLIKGKQYYLSGFTIISLAMLTFFISLERKKLKVSELVIIASVSAIAAASRSAFFFLPQIKPTCAVLIVAASVFGGEFGFLCGSITMLISNFMYGQGIWTPFQMLGMGLTVFLCGIILKNEKINRFFGGIISGLICFSVYGLTVDLASVFMMSASFNIKTIISIYSAGIYFNLVHGISTGIIVCLLLPPVREKLKRLKTKYGIFEK